MSRSVLNMVSIKKTTVAVSLATAVFSLLFSLVPDKSVCSIQSCLVASTFLMLSKKYAYLLSFVYFYLIFSFLRRTEKDLSLSFELLLLAGPVASLVFILRQLFDLKEICQLCLIFDFFLFAVPVSIFIYFSKYKQILRLGSVLIVLSFIFYLTQVPATKIDNSYTLVYSANCKHCALVKRYALDHNIKLKLLPYSKAKTLFHILELKGTPVLVIKSENSIKILSGDKKIIKFLKSFK